MNATAFHHAFGEKLFATLHTLSFDGLGMTRPSYSPQENAAHTLLCDVARNYGLEIRRDWAANLFLTLPGKDRAKPVVLTGSHMDTVPSGGNYDGAAGVIAGLSILCRWVRDGFLPERDTTVIATRAEESVWFPLSYVGSRTAFDLLTEKDLNTRRSDTGRTLFEHIAECGGTPQWPHTAILKPEQIDCFVELHIEQGPVLLGENAVLAVVSGICGSIRYRKAWIEGEYAHSGATPRKFRSDAVVAMADLVSTLHAYWQTLESEGHTLTLTFGVCQTDARQANFSAVAGKVSFTLDVRAQDTALLDHVDRHIQQVARTVEQRHRVKVHLGEKTGSTPALMDESLQQAALEISRELDIPALKMASGAGHDAATFANQGVPTEMLFVRNENGSHNPYEHLEIADFAAATTVLDGLLKLRAEKV
ncbi:hydantoinase/carbamoylase family amidase [Acetobacter sp. TBRC 12305]|uniref:Hydantoinase/carbamoylase family amidase n=1 Tax=Acetobacter garciniae TaxID=2817435 RepID=A0A939HHC9_9PROT|nr:Zn-dependent hydrolase [Acetobacter garciniae]MBO1324433.1 hydantoinase/carbamoylase family amidase [Acetobacter garciniae]MBX0344122.1 hydantoinase/carbamoylase family amidase [Acetobacter garciniae]